MFRFSAEILPIIESFDRWSPEVDIWARPACYPGLLKDFIALQEVSGAMTIFGARSRKERFICARIISICCQREGGERIADRHWCGCLLVDDGWPPPPPIAQVGLCRLTYLLLVWFQIFCQKSFDRASNDFSRMRCIYIIRRRRKTARIAYAATLLLYLCLSVFNIAS